MDDNVIDEILKQYPIRVTSISFIRHNENMTYKVTDEAAGITYLLRIHKAITSSMSGLQHICEGLDAEMAFLQTLHESKDAVVLTQTPVRNNSGDWVTCKTVDGEVVHSTLLQWINGRDLQQDESLSRHQITHFGEQVGSLHQFAKSTSMSLNKVRPAYAGITQNELMLKRLKHGVSMGIFSEIDYAALTRFFEVLNASLETYPQTANCWGIIHADINKGNLLLTPNGIALIDFCLFGYGYYLYDVAGSVLSLKPEERDYFLTGYLGHTAALSAQDMKRLEGFMMVAILGYYAFQLENEDRHSWMRERMPLFCQKYCLPFVGNQSIFYTF
ncbi:phosphotransferase enzyme family protein [Paenibacillus sp. FJAT-27812]|uniref:phosphotransferase enzyme family protein n=1 Tax=Paenibacillus sp. FJAT-27812 TaxID=1684143 RepID=UPI0006A75F23|nr:phosphotransferase [Paenibacillus sp. FJAT-27812]